MSVLVQGVPGFFFSLWLLLFTSLPDACGFARALPPPAPLILKLCGWLPHSARDALQHFEGLCFSAVHPRGSMFYSPLE